MTQASALYRRYRPDAFADVIGQEHVTVPLMTALKKNRVNHAYLFSGPRGCGKTTSARILARCLNCEQGPTDTPCGVCPSCVELARGGAGSLDVIEIDAASHGGVDDARDLRERATFAPARDRYKIFIIDEAHMVTSAGFNALLKIVEEPPEHIKFIFATTEPDKVIGTIRSRTHHYPFRLVPPEPLMAYLELLCQQENVQVAPGVLSLVIRAGGGSVRDSLSVLDQLMAGAAEGGITYELAVSLLGYTHASLLDDVVDAVAAHDAATVFSAVDRVLQTGHDPRRFVEDLLERFRDLIIVKAMPDSAESVLRGMPQDQINRMRQQANVLGAGELSRAADITNAALSDMTGATSPRLHLELLCARILLPAADHSERGAGARLDALERRVTLAVPASSSHDAGPATQRISPSAPAVASAPPVAAPAPTAARAQTPETAPAQTPASAQAAAVPESAAAPAPAPVADSGQAQNSSASSAPVPAAGQAAEGGIPVEALRRAWPEIVDRIGKIKRSTWALIASNASVAGTNGSTVILGFPTPGLVGAFGRGDHKDHVQQAILDVLGVHCRVDATSSDAPAPAVTNRPTATAGSTAAQSTAPVQHSAPPAASVEEPPGWDPAPKADADRTPAAPVGAPQQSVDQAPGVHQATGPSHPQASATASASGGQSWPPADSHPLDYPSDDDVPPLEEEPPYFDDAPSYAPSSPAPAASSASAPATITAGPTVPEPASAAPVQGTGVSADLSDPWTRAREQAPGRWSVSSESNIRTQGAASSSPEPAPSAVTPEASLATEVATPASSAAEAPHPSGQSMYQRLQASPEAQQAREEARLRAGREHAPVTSSSAPEFNEDEISSDDETIEQSAVFGRAAVERILEGTLIEELDHDGNPIIRR